MIISELLEMAEFTKHEQGYGLTSYENSNYILAGGMRSGSSSAGTTRLKYVIYDNVLFQETGDQEGSEIGVVELFVDDETGKIVGLVNIKLKPKVRKSGHGRQIIQDLKDTTEDGFTIHDIQKKAVKFWEKVGVDFENRSKTNGRIHKD